jgi:hypothetical protein
MKHVTLILAKTLLSDKRKEAVKRMKKGEKLPNKESIIEDCRKEIEAIDDELFLLNNW